MFLFRTKVEEINGWKEEDGAAGVVTVVGKKEQSRAVVQFKAKQVIMAIHPTHAAQLRWTPALPDSKAELLRSCRMGGIIKGFAIYDRPFWREVRCLYLLIFLSLSHLIPSSSASLGDWTCFPPPSSAQLGFSGEVVCDQASGPVFNVYDACKFDEHGVLKVAALVTFINGEA